MIWMLVGAVTLVGAGAAVWFFLIAPRLKRIDTGLSGVLTASIGWNISAGDLLGPDVESRLATYLDELARAGYRRQVRIIYTPQWGPFIREHWIPVIRAKGFKMLVIIGQERTDTDQMPEQAFEWARTALPPIADILLGVQIKNEFQNDFAPDAYLVWHGLMAPVVRAAVPGVPIVCGDFGPGDKGRNDVGAWTKLVKAGLRDYDIVSVHVTGVDSARDLSAMADELKALHGAGMEVWVTEGDFGQAGFLRACGLRATETFVFTYNDFDDSSLARRPGGRLA